MLNFQYTYGKRSMVVIDDALSASAVSDYATSLNSQLKDPVTQLTCRVEPAELDLQVGDRVKVEIPSKSIDTYYDLIQVTQLLSEDGLSSNCILNSRKEMRDIASFQDMNAFLAKVQRNLEIGLRGKIIK